eukprot:4889244-Lingulodinium_polyedra.AAC.1
MPIQSVRDQAGATVWRSTVAGDGSSLASEEAGVAFSRQGRAWSFRAPRQRSRAVERRQAVFAWPVPQGRRAVAIIIDACAVRYRLAEAVLARNRMRVAS